MKLGEKPEDGSVEDVNKPDSIMEKDNREMMPSMQQKPKSSFIEVANEAGKNSAEEVSSN